MLDVLLRIAGMPRGADRNVGIAGCFRGLWPLAAPFLILTCEPRWELAATAACWSVLIFPGLLAANLFFSANHPFGTGSGKLGVASVGGLVLFGLISWPACLLHWKLSSVLMTYGLVYVAGVGVLIAYLLRRGQVPDANNAPQAESLVPEHVSKSVAAVVLVGVAVVMLGVWLATLQTQELYGPQGLSYDAHGHWWQGTLLGAVAALGVAAVIWFRARNQRQTKANSPQQSSTKAAGRKSARKRNGADLGAKTSRGTAPGSWLTLFLWLGVAVLTWHVMNAGYRLRPQSADQPRHMSHRPWNSDDVSYVSQAVDYRYGLPLGKYESSIGSDQPLKRADLSLLVAPLVAAISLATGVGCAALHHSVLPPLIILVGMSALAAALKVVFRGDRWAVPLGLLIVAAMICKSWEYERSMVEFTVWRAMQTKSVHLWLIHPLQLATLLLLVRRPTWRHLFGCVAVAIVGHLAHPFATILGAVWSATVFAASAVLRRNALPKVLLVFVCYGLLGGAFYAASNRTKPQAGLSSGRVSGESEQSRDLVRIDDQPILRQEPRILFGWNVLFCFGAVATPLLLGFGRRNREFLFVGLLGAVAVAVCNSTTLGRLLNVALPTSIFWRARWLLPSLVNIAVVSFVLYWAFAAIISRRDDTSTPVRSFVACLATAGMFAVMLGGTSAYALKLGAVPRQLSKFSEDIHSLVHPLGGVEADPFVWGPRTVTRELPQLMPNVRLVLSRRKIMLPSDQPQFRQTVLRTRDIFYAPAGRFRGGKAPQDAHLHNALRQLTDLYPIDHFVLDYCTGRGEQGARVLKSAGWAQVGRSGIYKVWRLPSHQ